MTIKIILKYATKRAFKMSLLIKKANKKYNTNLNGYWPFLALNTANRSEYAKTNDDKAR